jgi:hypothetical protein
VYFLYISVYGVFIRLIVESLLSRESTLTVWPKVVICQVDSGDFGWEDIVGLPVVSIL